MKNSLAELNTNSQAVLNHKCLMVLYSAEMSIGKRIHQLRMSIKPRKMSQDAFGELCGGVSKSAVSQWESGTTEPDLQNLLKLRSKIVFSLDWLLTGEGEIGIVYKSDPVIAHVVNAMQNMEKEDASKLAAISDTFTKTHIISAVDAKKAQPIESKAPPDRRKKPDKGPKARTLGYGIGETIRSGDLLPDDYFTEKRKKDGNTI